MEIAGIIISDGGIVITDTQGNTTVNSEIIPILTDAPEKAIIIQDKNGDQYVVQKDAATGEVNVTKVEGGGLQPGENNLQEVVESTVVNPSYFITIPSDTTKYKHNTIFTFIRQSNKVLLQLNGHADSLKTKLIWRIDGKEPCKGVSSCDVNLNNAGTIKVEVLQEKISLLKVSVNIYRKPVIVFERGNRYAGEYGFDDGHKFTPLKSDYTKLSIEGSDYYVNWISLLDGQTIYIKANVDGLKSDAIKDKNFKITFRPSHGNIRINDTTHFTLSYNQLQNLAPIKIFSTAFSGMLNYIAPEKIEVLDHKGDLIGQINLICGNPEIRKVVFVYVDRGKGYATNIITKQSLLDFLNIKSHNQFYRRWELDPDPTFPDTLNIKNRYKKNSAGFTSSSAASLDSLVTYYQSSIKLTRLKAGTHFFFISDIPISRPNSNGGTDYVRGIADTNGFKGTIFDGGKQEETVHELGHNLRLNHTFEKVGSRIISEGTTKNYMDYTSGGRYMFFLYQWREVTQR